MKLVYHRLAVQDVHEVLDHYVSESGSHLADRFFESLLTVIEKIQANPHHFSYLGDTRLRRAQVTNFPYHVLYDVRPWGIKIMVVRHFRRRPRYGLRRQ